MLMKYPRTAHLPFSLSRTDDDKTLENCDNFIGKNVIVTIKMDGENSTLYKDYFHARSLDSVHHVSRDWLKAFHSTFKNDIPDGWRICGENCYAFHAIFYENLESYFYGFSIWNEENICLSWKETLEWFSLFGITPVKEIYSGIWNEKIIRNLSFENEEGFVVRNSESFSYDTFSENVAKCVRKNHVQTDKHWKDRPVIPNHLRKAPEEF